MLETDEMRVVAGAVVANSSWSPAHDGRDRLVIMIEVSWILSGAKEKNSPFPADMLAWVPASKNWSVPNKSGEEMKLMVLEFKDTPGKQSNPDYS